MEDHIHDARRQQETQALASRIQGAAREAEIGEQISRTIRTVAQQFMEKMAPPSSPLSPFLSHTIDVTGDAILVTPAAGLPKAPSLDGETLNRMAFVLQLLTKQQRGCFFDLLLEDPDARMGKFAAFLTGGIHVEGSTPSNVISRTAVFFGTKPEAIASLEVAQHRAMEAFLGSEAPMKLATIHAYLQHALPPTATARHRVPVTSYVTAVDETKLFDDLSQDPRFSDFIDEMPLLLTNASLATYHALASGVFSDEREGEGTDTEDMENLRTRLHLICSLQELLRQYYIYETRGEPISELESTCVHRVLLSVGKGLLLDYLHRHHPSVLLPPPSDDDETLERHDDRRFQSMQSIFRDCYNHLQHADLLPTPTPSQECFRLLSMGSLPKYDSFVRWLKFMTEGAASYDLSASESEIRDITKKPAETWRWLRATHCTREMMDGGVLFEVVSNRSAPSAGHDRITTHLLLEQTGDAPCECTTCCSACRHKPAGPAVSDNYAFIAPQDVLGPKHPLSCATQRVASLGDALHYQGCEMQRRGTWCEDARRLAMPLRFVVYAKAETGHYVACNIFSHEEADRLQMRGRLEPVSGRYLEMYNDLKAVNFSFPHDARGMPLLPKDLCLEILDEGDDWGGGDDEEAPPEPLEGGGHHRSRTTTSRFVGSGMR